MVYARQQLIQATNSNKLSHWGWICCCMFILQLALICPMACIIDQGAFSPTTNLQSNPNSAIFICQIAPPAVVRLTSDQTFGNARYRHQLVALFAMVLVGLHLLRQLSIQSQHLAQPQFRVASFALLPTLPPPRCA